MKPAFRIEVQEPGKAKVTDITAFAAERLISLRAVDAAGYSSDRFDLALDYRPGRGNAHLGLPPSHRTMKLYLGFGNEPAYIGQYIVDRLSLMLDRDVLNVRASAADWRSRMKEPRSQSWDGQTIGTIVRTIAARHEFKPAVAAEYAAMTIPAHRPDRGIRILNS